MYMPEIAHALSPLLLLEKITILLKKITILLKKMNILLKKNESAEFACAEFAALKLHGIT